jgi:hypothetical protein
MDFSTVFSANLTFSAVSDILSLAILVYFLQPLLDVTHAAI